MNPHAMEPFGAALLAWFEGHAISELVVRRDDGTESPLPVGYFFREQADFTPLEMEALSLCRGHVLDVGAGTGLHSKALQSKEIPVTAIDISPQAVAIMKQRCVKDVYLADIFEFRDRRFDTILMLGHGIGMVETMAGLDRFLVNSSALLTIDGQMLLDSLDVRITDDPANLAYHESNRKAGRCIGEIRMQFEFQGKRGPFCGWLQVDADTLRDHAVSAGWNCEIVCRESNGNYLARLSRSTPGREFSGVHQS